MGSAYSMYPPAVAPPALILGGLLGVVDHDHFDRGFLRFQLETQLLLKRGEDIYAAGIGRWWLAVVGRPVQREIIKPSKARFVEHRAIHAVLQITC